MQKILEIYFKLYAYLENNKFLNSIKRSLILLVPVFMIGAISLAIQYFPIEGFRTFISTEFNGVIYSFLDGVYKSTFGLVSLYLVIAVSFYYSKNFTKKESLRFYSSINSIICYFIFLGPNFFSESKVDIFSYTNMTNVFAALISSLISVHLFFLFIELFLKVKKTKIEAKNELQVAMYSLCSMVVDALIATVPFPVAVKVPLMPSDVIAIFSTFPFPDVTVSSTGISVFLSPALVYGPKYTFDSSLITGFTVNSTDSSLLTSLGMVDTKPTGAGTSSHGVSLSLSRISRKPSWESA